MLFEADDVVAGAGPCGVTLANLLGVYGVTTVVIDREAGVVDYPPGGGRRRRVAAHVPDRQRGERDRARPDPERTDPLPRLARQGAGPRGPERPGVRLAAAQPVLPTDHGGGPAPGYLLGLATHDIDYLTALFGPPDAVGTDVATSVPTRTRADGSTLEVTVVDGHIQGAADTTIRAAKVGDEWADVPLSAREPDSSVEIRRRRAGEAIRALALMLEDRLPAFAGQPTAVPDPAAGAVGRARRRGGAGQLQPRGLDVDRLRTGRACNSQN